jgi:type I restriction enzyme, S subunit
MKQQARLGDVADFVNGAAFRPEDWGEDGYPIIRIQNLTDSSKPFNHTRRQVDERLYVNRGDLLVSWSATLGVFEWDRAETGVVNQHIFRVIPDLSKVDKAYLRHAVVVALLAMQKHLHGATMQHVNRGEFLSTPLRVPPLAEQRRIAAILDQADALRAKRREALAELHSLTQSIFIEMFGDPVLNTSGWELTPLGTVGTLDRGVSKARPRNAPELLGGPYPLIQTGDVANCDAYIRQHTATYSEIGLRQSRLWPAGTLCITIAANIAKTGILTFAACFPDSVVGFNAPQAATVEYVRVWVSFLQKALEDAAPESAQKNINLAILRDLKIPVPPLDLQQTFAARINTVESLKATHRAALADTDALFASLQHRAFTGQLP